MANLPVHSLTAEEITAKLKKCRLSTETAIFEHYTNPNGLHLVSVLDLARNPVGRITYTVFLEIGGSREVLPPRPKMKDQPKLFADEAQTE